MPELNKFIDGFGLNVANHEGFSIIDVQGNHQVIKLYHEYLYHIVVTAKGDYSKISDYLAYCISQTHIIYGIKNPYRCTIDFPKNGDIIDMGDHTYEFHFTGHSYRI